MPRLSGDWSLRPGQPELLGEEAAQNHLSSRDSPIAGGGAEAGSVHLGHCLPETGFLLKTPRKLKAF